MNNKKNNMLHYSTPKAIKSQNASLMASVPSTSSRSMSRELLEEFLNAYRNSPCLWKIKSSDYLNKELKADAYRQLEAICQKEHPDANRDFVSKKINSLRGSFRREYRRVITESNYVPQLWFYELLHFTAEQENDLGELKMKHTKNNNVSYSSSNGGCGGGACDGDDVGGETTETDYVSTDYCFVSAPEQEDDEEEVNVKHFFKADNYGQIHHVNGETMQSNLSDNNDTVSSMICTTLEEAGDCDENAHHTNDDVTTTIEIPSDETNGGACCYETDADGFVAQLVEIQDDNTSVIALVDANDDNDNDHDEVMQTETIDDECQSPVSSVVSVSKRRKLIANGCVGTYKNGQIKSGRINFSRINRVSPTAHKATLTNCISTIGMETVNLDTTPTNTIASTSSGNIIGGGGGGSSSVGTIYSTNIPTTIRHSTTEVLQPTAATTIGGSTANTNNTNNPINANGFDEFSAYGVTVAAKLRQMEPHQRLFAENIINQTLFLGVVHQLEPPSFDDMMFNIGIRHIKREMIEDDE